MKFLCDRCKTRYSIADERVRGKILKIRCKNCSAVISVREGMDEPAAWSAPAPAAAAAPSPVPSAPVRPPPASLHEEWYVSLDGNQEGPFLLPEAQAWVSAKSPDDELHCWCEGFDDWLPVEKVSHFRGLRGKVTRARTPTNTPPPLSRDRAGGLSETGAPAPAKPAEPEPKPLFAATLAALEQEAEKDAEKKAAAAAKPPLPGAAAAASVAATTAAVSAPAKKDPGTGSLPRLSPTTLKSTPATGAPKLPTPGVPAVPKAAAPPSPLSPSATGSIPVSASAIMPAATPPPLPATPRAGGGLPPLQTLGGPAGAAPSIARAAAPQAVGSPAPLPATPAPAPSSSSSTSIPRPAPMFDTGPESMDGGNGASSANDDIADAATRRDPVDDIEDDLSIGEVSRVVRLADIAAKIPPKKPAAPAAAAAAAAAIARGTGMVARIDPSEAAGAAAAPGAEGAPNMYQALVAAPPRRRTLLYIGIGVVALALAAVLILVATSGGGGSDEEVASATRNYDDLGGTIDNPLVRRPGLGKQVEGLADAGVGAGTGRRPTGSGGRPGGGSATGSNNASGSSTQTNSQIGPDGMPLRPLSADDVFAMSSKMEIGTRRCYERALKDDPFLKVSKIKATITVKPAGQVSNVQLSAMQGTPLATCLTAAIGRWRFRPSTEGIVSEFALVFEQR